ncbi:MAG TPA: VOC family protein [Fimbriimonadaceae bacterium]|nr:VOC family protein [Fimbriimonadaceae bacterium]
MQQRIRPFLWYDRDAEHAAEFYVSLFTSGKIHSVSVYNDHVADQMGLPHGTAMTVDFEIEGMQFTALNGGPMFKFNESVSFVINCADQAEIDRLWTALTADGGEESMCGWLKDRFGLSWQIVPENIGQLLSTPAAMENLLQMRKIDIAALASAT